MGEAVYTNLELLIIGTVWILAHPSLAKNRLVSDEEGKYRILLKTSWSYGTSSIQLGLLELMERLVAIIPQLRTHQFLYHGVIAKECVRSPDFNRNPRKEVQREAWCQVMKRGFAEVSESTSKNEVEEIIEEGCDQ